MQYKIFTYPILIKEVYLDTFGHVNNAVYLTLLEEARWDLITNNGFGIPKIRASGQGPTILEINIVFKKELRLRDRILIETQLISYEDKIGILEQRMLRGEDLCCQARFKIALFDLHKRKIILPTPEWLKAIGAE